MIDLAWRWCRVLDIDPSLQPNVPVPDLGLFAGQLAKVLTDLLAAAAGLPSAEYSARLLAGRHPAPAAWRRRDPTPAEQQAARQLAARLQRARTHQPEPATRPSPIPPGRLRVRHAITEQAQRESGALPTAAPWQQRANLPPPKPALRLGVLVDVSASMASYAAPMSSAAWILAHAARQSHATTTTIAFGGTVTLLVPPRQHPTQVLNMRTGGGTSTFISAVKLADQLLDLRHRGALRMLAVVSDGDLADIEPAQKLISTLHRAGCAVLWLRPKDLSGHTFRDTTTITIDHPVEAIEHIARAAVTALENA
jgi:Mg-chelatase subunit ChlD